MRPVKVSSLSKGLPVRVINVRERLNESVVTVLNYTNMYVLCNPNVFQHHSGLSPADKISQGVHLL